MISFKHLLAISLLFTGMALNVDTVFAMMEQKKEAGEQRHYVYGLRQELRGLEDKNNGLRRQLKNIEEEEIQKQESEQKSKVRQWKIAGTIIAGALVYYLYCCWCACFV